MKLFQRIGAWFSAHRPTKRRIIQLYAALLTNANLKGFKNGQIYTGDVKKICAPGLNCYSCPAASASCPLGALQQSLSQSGTRLPYYVFGILILFGLIFARWICGFLCPFGLIQDLLHKIKTPKIKKGRVTRVLSNLKYVILAVFVIGLPLIYGLQAVSFPLPAFCKYICPAGTSLGAGGLLANEANDGLFSRLGALFTWKFCLLVIFLVGSVFIYRFFCRFFCPLGAIYGFFNRISLLGMKVDEKNCTDCGLCVGKCPMDIRKVGDHECISCGECISVCPTGAISRKGPKILLPPNEIGGRTAGAEVKAADELLPAKTPLPKKTKAARAVVAVLLAALLGGALYYYNVYDRDPSSVDGETTDEVPTETTAEDTVADDVTGEETAETVDPSETTAEPAPTLGKNIGDLCYSFEMPTYNVEGVYSVEDTRGKITVLNFWATSCSPCVHELLTEFPLVPAQYGDDVQVVAIHSSSITAEVQPYIDAAFPGFDFIFCQDATNPDNPNDGGVYYRMLGGTGSIPYTLVLDEDGVIIAKFSGATSYDELKPVIDKALAD